MSSWWPISLRIFNWNKSAPRPRLAAEREMLMYGAVGWAQIGIGPTGDLIRERSWGHCEPSWSATDGTLTPEDFSETVNFEMINCRFANFQGQDKSLTASHTNQSRSRNSGRQAFNLSRFIALGYAPLRQANGASANWVGSCAPWTYVQRGIIYKTETLNECLWRVCLRACCAQVGSRPSWGSWN